MNTFPFTSDALKDRVCLITGGGTGIGRAIALGMARCGAKLILASRKVENCTTVAEECRALGVEAAALPLDIRDPASVAACFAEVSRLHAGQLDVLVNNAGANFTAPALGISPNGWRVITQTLIDGTFFCSQAAARLMLERGGGRIINNAGTNGWNGSPLMAHSGVGKAGILSMTETLAVEWGPLGITVNAVAPGAVSTSGANSRLWSQDATMARIAKKIPLGQRFGTPDDCVGAFLFLASDAAAFITGATVTIDGGQRLRSTLDLGNE